MHALRTETVSFFSGQARSAVTCVVCAAALTVASVTDVWIIRCGAAVIGMCCLALCSAPGPATEPHSGSAAPPGSRRSARPRVTPRPVRAARRGLGVVEDMLHNGRYTLLLRPQIFDGLSDQHRESAVAALNEEMVKTPGGKVQLFPLQIDARDEQHRIVELDPFYLDRYQVTNLEFERFVLAGGYEQASLWSPKIVGRIADFTDQTGQPGPRFWKNGQFPEGQELFPVVGVNWYEAMAYARWVGKRLPSDPEWVKAAASPVELSDGRIRQRMYPWGDTMDRAVANVWGSGPVAVNEFAGGATPHGAHQLIGNVWEWMYDDFGAWEEEAERLETIAPMKSIRGGAFDTYFDNQATTRFPSAEAELARKHNIGFRCAIAAQDLSTVVAF